MVRMRVQKETEETNKQVEVGSFYRFAGGSNAGLKEENQKTRKYGK